MVSALSGPFSRLNGARLLASAVALSLAGCASFSSDGRIGPVADAVKSRGGEDLVRIRNDDDADKARAAVKALLAQALSAEAAVRVALANNRGLQAAYADLGIAEADWVEAGRLRNPLLSLGRFTRNGDVEIERGIRFDILGLFTLPIAGRAQARRIERVQAELAGQVLQLAADTRRSWVRAVAAAETARYMEQVRVAAEAAAELARRMNKAGNFNRLTSAREQAFLADATAQLTRSRQLALAEREKLTRLLGLAGADVNFTLPERLPDLPRAAREITGVEAQALSRRLDLQASRSEAASLAESLGLARVNGTVNVLELGWKHTNETGRSPKSGPELEFRLPVFDWSGARGVRAERQYRQAVDRTAQLAVEVQSEVREAYAGYRSAFEVSRHYRDEVVPLRKLISEENLLRYNGMLISVFELLADAREQVSSVNAYIESLRDFWEADTALEFALTGRSAATQSLRSTAAPAAATATMTAH